MLYGSQIDVRLASSGKKHGGTLTIRFLDSNSISVPYSVWSEAWKQEIRNIIAKLRKVLAYNDVEGLLLQPESFGLALSMEQSGRAADVVYDLVCFPNGFRRGPGNACCLRYALRPSGGRDDWNVVEVANGMKKNEK